MPKTKERHPRVLPFKRPLREVGLFLLDILYNAVIIIALVVLIRTFLISPFRVEVTRDETRYQTYFPGLTVLGV